MDSNPAYRLANVKMDCPYERLFNETLTQRLFGRPSSTRWILELYAWCLMFPCLGFLSGGFSGLLV